VVSAIEVELDMVGGGGGGERKQEGTTKREASIVRKQWDEKTNTCS
jgi:hypothetical protein